jgi:hypothetical protein
MTWYPDLSQYVYWLGVTGGHEPTSDALNVGWLDQGQPFPTADPAPEFVERLLYLCVRRRENVTRGWHLCQFCPRRPDLEMHGLPDPAEVAIDGERHFLGDAEIHVPGRGVTYYAPNLIVHYVAEHQYAPPEEFVAAVLQYRRTWVRARLAIVGRWLART